jgi:hypothetical protein
MISVNISKENISEIKAQINLLANLKFIYGSFQLNYTKNKNGEYKKNPVYHIGWKKQTTSFF